MDTKKTEKDTSAKRQLDAIISHKIACKVKSSRKNISNGGCHYGSAGTGACRQVYALSSIPGIHLMKAEIQFLQIIL